MIPMELNAFKAQITNEVNQSTSIDELLDRLYALFHTYSREAEEASWQHIPGLPYTKEERRKSLSRAEAEVMSGQVSLHDGVLERMKQKMDAWK